MNKDLTVSNIQRQNVLNNRLAVSEIQHQLPLGGISFDGEKVFTKSQVAKIFDVDERTIDNYISNHKEELTKNGCSLVTGQKLKDFKELVFAHEIDFASKTTQLVLFPYKAVLNLAMLITVSEKAKVIRSKILDIVIDSISQKVRDRTYINQRDEDYIISAFQEENYRKEFTNAIDHYIETTSKYKYAQFTNMVYKAIFEENAKEYRQVLNLKAKGSIRNTLYAEVLDVISGFEAGFAEELKDKSEELNRKLSSAEATELFNKFAKKAFFKPSITKAKTIMASRDFSLREAIHEKLEAYIQAMPEADYEKFLGEKSKELDERIKENLEVYKRLKDR